MGLFTLTILVVAFLAGCGGVHSSKYAIMADGSKFRMHTLTSHDVSAPTVTTLMLEACDRTIYETTKVKKKGHMWPGPSGAMSSRWETVTTVDPVERLECELVNVGNAVGSSRVRDYTGLASSAVTAAGFAAGMHFLEPDKFESTSTTTVEGSTAASDVSQEGATVSSESGSTSISDSDSSSGSRSSATAEQEQRGMRDLTVGGNNATHSDDQNVYNDN